jgi:TRAP transporter TAXI family solute receptor
MKKTICLVAVIALALFTIWNAPAMAKDVRIFIGATGTASGHYAYWVSVGEAIKKFAPGVSPTVVESGGALDNADRLIRKQVDLGLTNIACAYQVYYGKAKWEGKPHPEFRWLWVYSVHPMDLVVREDSGIKSIRELTGKRFCAGARGSGGEKLLQMIFELLEIKPNYYRGGYSDAVAAVEDRQIVGMAKWAAGEEIGDALITRLSTTTKLRWLSFSDEDMKKITKACPYVLVAQHPAGIYKGQDYPIQSIGTGAASLTTTNISPDLGYKFCKAVWDGKSIQEEAFPANKNVHLFKAGVKYAPIPLHAGAVKMCKELGIEVPKKLIPPEYK